MKGLRAKFNTPSLSELGSGLRAMQSATVQRAVLGSISVSLVLVEVSSSASESFAATTLRAEYGTTQDELRDAIRSNNLESVRYECLDLAAVLIRLARAVRGDADLQARSVK